MPRLIPEALIACRVERGIVIDWSIGAKASTPLSPKARKAEATARSAPTMGASIETSWAQSIRLASSVVATSPSSQLVSHTVGRSTSSSWPTSTVSALSER